MSALGHKRTFAVQQPMSALPPIATWIAYFQTGPIPSQTQPPSLTSVSYDEDRRRVSGPSPTPPHPHDIGRCWLDDLAQARRPQFKRVAFFIEVCVLIVK